MTFIKKLIQRTRIDRESGAIDDIIIGDEQLPLMALPRSQIPAHCNLDSILTGTMALPLGMVISAKSGMSASSISDKTGLFAERYGKSGSGNGAQSSGSCGNGSGNAVERIVGAYGGPFLVRLSPPAYPKFARRT